MSAIGTILGILGKGLFKDIANLVDEVVTSKEEKLQIKAAIKIKEIEFKQEQDELELKFEQELTQRHASDMTSDSWLSKNIRPLTLIFTVAIFTLLSFSIGIWSEFQIPNEIIETYKWWGMLCFSFYFGSRGFEKISKIIKK